MKNKLNPLHTFDNKSPTTQPLSSPCSRDFPPHRLSPDSRLPPPAGPVSLPLRTSILEEPERFTQTPLNSAVSPRAGPFSMNSRNPRSPGGNSDVDYPQRRRLSVRTNSTSLADDSAVSPRGYDTDVREDAEIAETSSMRRLQIDDASRGEYYVAGLKRRASSPPGEEPMLHTVTSQGDLRRRELSRGSPTPRLAVTSRSSISSVSSKDRSSSFTSTFSVAGHSSSASVNSFGQRSPVGRSPVEADLNAKSPYAVISPSPRGSMARASHQPAASESRPVAPPRRVGEAAKPNGQRMPGFILMCECCPKKPKKFETMEELAYVLPSLLPMMRLTNSIIALMRPRNNTNVPSAVTASRTRMRPSDTRTAYMCDGTAGVARHSRTTARLFTRAQTDREKRIPVATAAGTSTARVRSRLAGSVARLRIKTGTSAHSTS